MTNPPYPPVLPDDDYVTKSDPPLPTLKDWLRTYMGSAEQILENVEQAKKHTDTINHPPHYTQGKIECVEVLEQLGADGEDFRILTAMKYLWRWRHKGGIEDLQKAVWYINRVIESPTQGPASDRHHE